MTLFLFFRGHLPEMFLEKVFGFLFREQEERRGRERPANAVSETFRINSLRV